MIVFTAEYKKKDGSVRSMKFCRLDDLPPAASKNKRIMSDGQEVVWDLQKNAFRVFNWNTVVGKATAKII